MLLLIDRFDHGTEKARGRIYRQYLEHTQYINNWDLVDSSAGKIVGAYLQARDRKPLYRLARSASLWERRIAVIATSRFIAMNDFDDCIAICALLLDDQEDLIHKASGWMLREIGKRDTGVEKAFLDRYCKRMPRTMLRYAIERLPQADRRAYLTGARDVAAPENGGA